MENERGREVLGKGAERLSCEALEPISLDRIAELSGSGNAQLGKRGVGRDSIQAKKRAYLSRRFLKGLKLFSFAETVRFRERKGPFQGSTPRSD